MTENEFYFIDFVYDKCSLVLALESGPDKEGIMKSLDGQRILAQYRGVSKVDNKKLFVINLSQINRQSILDNLGI